ncbi:LOW QUALITY PROTEIN: pre-B-cell leukemia transcription factor-interacting protein 1 [Guaruba guarouba]
MYSGQSGVLLLLPVLRMVPVAAPPPPLSRFSRSLMETFHRPRARSRERGRASNGNRRGGGGVCVRGGFGAPRAGSGSLSGGGGCPCVRSPRYRPCIRYPLSHPVPPPPLGARCPRAGPRGPPQAGSDAPRPPARRLHPAINTRVMETKGIREQLLPVAGARGGAAAACEHRRSPGPGLGRVPSAVSLQAAPGRAMAEKPEPRDAESSSREPAGSEVRAGPRARGDAGPGPKPGPGGRQAAARGWAGLGPRGRRSPLFSPLPAVAVEAAAVSPVPAGLGVLPGDRGTPQHPEECRDPRAEPPQDGSAEPGGDEQEEPDAEPDADAEPPAAEPSAEEGTCTSSDDDVEGLRRRGHEPHPGPPSAVAASLGTPGARDEDGLSMSKYLLGAVALVAVGLLIVSGGIYDPADDPTEHVENRDVAAGEQEPLLPIDSNASKKKLPPSGAGDPRSPQSLSLLLDKLAKENQEIRLMQAELQAHKEELQVLLHKSEGKVAAAGAQQQSLEAENGRLRAALEREAAALREARAELQRLREAAAPEHPPGASGEAVRHEGARLVAVRRELVGALGRARGAGGLEALVAELSLEQRLGRELEAGGPWKKPFKAEKKESKRRKQHGTGEHERSGHGKPHGHSKDAWFPREHKPGKAWGKPPHGPPLSRYRAPQGCTGVAECALKEGREVLGTALEPVRKTQFLRLLEGFMGGLAGQHFGGVAARLDGAFGRWDFAHDRLRFTDFVEEVEEMLEEVARRERGREDAADGFEEFVLRHYRQSEGQRGRGGARGSALAPHHSPPPFSCSAGGKERGLGAPGTAG